MKTGRNRFLKINRGLKKSFSFKWKQKRRHGELDFSKWNQKLKPSRVPCRLLARSPFLQLPPHFPITVMLSRCLFSLMRYPSQQQFVANIPISARGQELICAECSALCSGLGLVYIVQRPYPPVPLPAQCYWRASREACLDINTKVWNYRFFWPPAGSVPTALPRLSSTDCKALLKEISACIYKQGNCAQEKLIAEPKIVDQLLSPRPVPDIQGYACLSGSCYGQLPLTAALVFLNVPGLF